MYKQSIKKYLLIFLAAVLTAPSTAFALQCPGGVTITNMVCNVANVILYIGGALVIVLWIITGYLFLAAQGDPAKLTKAKLALFTSIAGTIIMVLAIPAIDIISSVLSGNG